MSEPICALAAARFLALLSGAQRGALPPHRGHVATDSRFATERPSSPRWSYLLRCTQKNKKLGALIASWSAGASTDARARFSCSTRRKNGRRRGGGGRPENR